jgi:hypothetical protein
MNQLTNSYKTSGGAERTSTQQPATSTQHPATNQIEVKDKVQQSGLNTNLKRVLRTKSSLLGI